MSTIDVARELTRTDIQEIDNDQLLKNDNRELFAAIRDMKLSKALSLHGAKASGDVDAGTCDAILSVLKTDIAVCDILAATDFDDEADVKASLRMIETIISSSPQPDHQEEYLGALNENEVSMEYVYMQAITQLQGMAKSA